MGGFRMVLFATAAIATAGTAAAETATTPGQVEELVVTARRQQEQLKDVPLAVTAMTGPALREGAVRGVEDIQYRTPSLSVAPATGSDATAQISLRGQVQNASFGTLDPSVGVYLDDVYVARAYGAMFDFLDTDRVEILKGPQGTLYGRNTTGGAIKLISKKANPDAAFGGYLTGEIGNYDLRQIEGAVNLPLVDDKLALRVAGRVTRRDGFSTLNIGPSDGTTTDQIHQNDIDEDLVRGNLIWKATDRLTVSLNGDYFQSDNNSRLEYARTEGGGDHITSINANGNAVTGVRSSSDFFTARSNIHPFSHVTASGESGVVEYKMSENLDTKVVVAHRRTDSLFLYDADGTDFPNGANTIIQNANQTTAEWQLNGVALDHRLDYVGGAFWFDEKGQDFAGVERLTSASRLGGYFENKSASAYIHGNYKVTDKIDLSGGIRYTRDDKSALLASGNVVNGVLVCGINSAIPGLQAPPTGSPDPCYLPRDDKFSYVSWSAAFDYHFTSDVMGYLRADKSSRGGGQNLRATTPGGSLPFSPETATSVEVGFKGDAFDRRMSFAADYYHTFYKDFQYTANAPSGLASGAVVTLTANATGDSHIDGVELEDTWRLTDTFSVDVAGSWVHVVLAQPTEAPQGIAVQLIPTLQYSVGANYTHDTSLGQLRARLEYDFKDKVGYDASRLYTSQPGHRLPSFGLINGSLTLLEAKHGLEITAWIRNAADKHYFVRSIRITGFPASGLNWDNAQVGEPRMYGLTLTKHW